MVQTALFPHSPFLNEFPEDTVGVAGLDFQVLGDLPGCETGGCGYELHGLLATVAGTPASAAPTSRRGGIASRRPSWCPLAGAASERDKSALQTVALVVKFYKAFPEQLVRRVDQWGGAGH
jgi:hypothetical protein